MRDMKLGNKLCHFGIWTIARSRAPKDAGTPLSNWRELPYRCSLAVKRSRRSREDVGEESLKRGSRGMQFQLWPTNRNEYKTGNASVKTKLYHLDLNGGDSLHLI